jgi:hypothetical protein
MSMLLFALSLNPLLQVLEQNLTGIRISRPSRKTAVVAYANDITIFVTRLEDIPAIRDAIRTYERATGATLNIRKSKAMAVGAWDAMIDMMGILYCKEMRILCASFTSTVAQTVDISWARVTGKVRALARDVYGRDLCLIHRIQYVHTYLLTKICHTGQIFLASKVYVRQLIMAITWYIRHGAMFRVPISTSQRRKQQGGLELIDVATKCRVLLFARLWAQGKRDRSLTAEWLQFWGLLTTRPNPPNLRMLLQTLEYLRIYALERAYIGPRRHDTLKAFKRRAYNALRIISTAETIPRVVRVMQLQPEIKWLVVLRNLHITWTSEGAKSAWYVVMHVLIATNVRLHKNRLTDTTNCNQCGRQDTSLHRLTECGEGQVIREWTRTRMAWMDRTDPRRIPREWLLTPHF